MVYPRHCLQLKLIDFSAGSSLEDGEYDTWVERVAEDGLSQSVRGSVVSSMQHAGPGSEGHEAEVAKSALQLLQENLQQLQ